MSDHLYALEKLETAVVCLATGEGDVRSRLCSAYREFHPLRPEWLPASLRGDYEWIVERLTSRRPVHDESRVEATMARMRNRTAAKIAQRLWDVYSRLTELLLRERAVE